MADFWVPLAYAVLVWWLTTGVVWWLDRLPRSTFRWSMAGATALLLTAAYLLRISVADPSPRGAYLGFSAAILMWGWLEMSFLMGFITGPRKQGCVERCSGWRHFLHATQAIIYNELATLLGAAALLAVTYRAPNRVALWTYLILWTMRLSAKLNLFLGVPNLGEQFLPAHLQYLKSFFRRRSMNFLFPLTITTSTLLSAYLVRRSWTARDGFHSVGNALEASLLMLAVLEHWFMVLPIPSETLWSWAFKGSAPEAERHPCRETRLAAEVPSHT
jgi:putative photosynthetic complex assembly protein 2